MAARTRGALAVQNRRARHDYLIDETLEAGLMLTGTEVKSLRAGRGSIAEAHAGRKDGELVLLNAHIPKYDNAGPHLNHAEKRPRRLLVHKRERERLFGLAQKEGVTLIPLAIYFNERGIAKLELGLARGKKKADKRETEKTRDWERQKARLLREKV